MTKYELTVNVRSDGAEVASISANNAEEAAFLLGAQFGMTAALRDQLYSVVTPLLGEDRVVDTFVASAQESITSVTIKTV